MAKETTTKKTTELGLEIQLRQAYERGYNNGLSDGKKDLPMLVRERVDENIICHQALKRVISIQRGKIENMLAVIFLIMTIQWLVFILVVTDM